MVSNQSSHLWLARFCAHLMRLNPEVSARTAVRRGVAAYPYADELMPEEAATIAASHRPPDARAQQFKALRA